MRGKAQSQPEFLTTINLNQCVPAERPLRGIKARADKTLKTLSPLFNDLYAKGWPSLDPAGTVAQEPNSHGPLFRAQQALFLRATRVNASMSIRRGSIPKAAKCNRRRFLCS